VSEQLPDGKYRSQRPKAAQNLHRGLDRSRPPSRN